MRALMPVRVRRRVTVRVRGRLSVRARSRLRVRVRSLEAAGAERPAALRSPWRAQMRAPGRVSLTLDHWVQGQPPTQAGLGMGSGIPVCRSVPGSKMARRCSTFHAD